jgi:hypothetical protein
MPNKDWITAAMKKLKLLSLNIGLLIVLQAAPCYAESFSAIGRIINFTNPPNYCTAGDSQEEKEVMRRTQMMVGSDVKLVHWAVPCKEKEEFRTGKRRSYEHWLHIGVLGTKGEFKPVTGPRERFLASISKMQPKLDMTEMNKRFGQAMKDQSVRINEPGIEIIGRDGNALYFTVRMKLTTPEMTLPTRGIVGLTLINSVPLTVNAYDASDNDKDGTKTQAAMSAVVQSLLTEN